MRKKLVLFIALGISSLIGQTVLLRELLIEVQGNEIVFSIYLSLWLFMIAVGSWLSRFFIQKTNLKKCITPGFLLLSILLLLQFFGIRLLGSASTIVSGQIFSIGNIFLIALVILSPGCLVLGALFPLLCSYIKEIKEPVHAGYIFESIGIVLGGILFALGILFLPHILLLLLVGMINVIILFIVSGKRYLFILIVIFLIAGFFAEDVFMNYYADKYHPQKLQFSRDSKYGRLDVTKANDQLDYFWNGELFAHTDNESYAAQMVNFVMLQKPNAETILMVGGMLNGFVSALTRYENIERIDYLELDKNMIAFAPHHPDVQYIRDDPIHYLRKMKTSYDVIFIDVPDPTSLLLNRYYTLNFFQLAQKRFADNSSLMAMTLSSGSNFMTPEIAQMNASVWKTFSKVFSFEIVIPSEKNIFIGSNADLLTNDVKELQLRSKNYQSQWFTDAIIFERCNKLRIHQFIEEVSGKGELNTISNPVAYLSAVSVWTSILDMNISSVISWMKKHIGLIFVISSIIILLLSFGASKLNRVSEVRTDMQIFMVSLVNFVMQIVLLNLFQMQFGNIYFMIFLFTSLFMIGLTAGFVLRKKININISWLYVINFVLAGSIWLMFDTLLPGIAYLLLNSTFAFLEGSILAKLLDVKYQKEQILSGSTFYFLDSLGSMVGGLIIGVLLFPILGIRVSVLVLVCLLIGNMLIQIKPQRFFNK